MPVEIHPTAIVDSGAKLGENVRIGPYSIVEDNVWLGDNTEVKSHAVVKQFTRAGSHCVVYPFAVLGGEPQHTGFRGEQTELHLGDRVTIRESVTLSRGTEAGGGVTQIGSDTMIMAYAHVAHDCRVGKHVLIVNGVQLGGHVTIEDYVFIGGLSAVTQFCRIGSHCYIAGGSILRKDVPPFLTGKGGDFVVQGVNSVGLARRGFEKQSVVQIRKLYKIFYSKNLTVAQASELATVEVGDVPEVRQFIDFVKNSKAGIVR